MKKKRARARLRALQRRKGESSPLGGFALEQAGVVYRFDPELRQLWQTSGAMTEGQMVNRLEQEFRLLRRNGKTFATLDALGIPFERKSGDE